MMEIHGKDTLEMWTILGVMATLVNTFVSFMRFIHDIRKDRKQESNRPSPR